MRRLLVFLAQHDVGVFLPADVVALVVERQRRPVLDIALHLAVARLEGAELGTGQPQPRHRLHVVDQLLGQVVGATLVEHGLQFFQKLGILAAAG
jgi:hypothetical protein